MKKRIAALVLAVGLSLGLAACGGGEKTVDETVEKKEVEISLWTYGGGAAYGF